MCKTLGAIGGLMLACAFVLADDPPRKKEDAPQAKQSDDQEKKEKKAKPPSGYEDAPEAGDRPPARNAAAAQIVIEALEAVDAADVGEGFAKLLAAKVDANVINLEAQFLPQFTPLMTAELSFINRVCDLNLDQRQKIKAVSAMCLKGAARKYAVTQNGMMQGVFRGGTPTVPDPTDLIHQALAQVLGETLQPEQRAAYDGEMAQRKSFRKRVAIDCVIAIIDERLVLAVEQRQKLAEALDKNWQPGWVQSLEVMVNNNQYLPSIPDQFVVPVLNEIQKRVWLSDRKQNFATWGGFAWGQQGGAVDDFPLAEDVADAD
ncbi:MAG: hypothetical protein ABI614_21005 [Planctomycetota bacterium]